jgi:hypothetical protein
MQTIKKKEPVKKEKESKRKKNRIHKNHELIVKKETKIPSDDKHKKLENLNKKSATNTEKRQIYKG